MNRSGLKSLMGYQAGGDIDSMLQEYEKDYLATQKPTFDPAKLQERVQTFSQYFPQQQQNDIWELISALGKGLLAQQSEKLPSMGRGLAYGLNIFEEANQKKKDEAKKISDTIFGMALKDYESDRDAELKFRQSLLDKKYDLLLEDMKNRGGFFQGTNPVAQAFNYILLAEKDPSLKYKNGINGEYKDEYRFAREYVQQPQVQYVQTETGVVPVTRPGFDLNKIFPEQQQGGTNIEIGGMFPNAPYLSYQLQSDGKTFLDTSTNKEYIWNETTQKMDPK